MSETGLLVAEVAFLVLLYAFVWSVVRSSSRQLRASQPPPMVVPDAPPAETPAAAAPAPPAPAPVRGRRWSRRPPSAPPVAAATAASEAQTEMGAAEEDSGVFDLGSNLDPRLIVEDSPSLEAGRVIALEGGITIGRSDAADLPITDQFVSHMHARILRRGAYHFVEDLGSTNGTFLNDRRVENDAAAQGPRRAEDRADDSPLRGIDDRRGRRRTAGSRWSRWPTSPTPAASGTTTRTAPWRAAGCWPWPTAWAAPRRARSPRRWRSTRSAASPPWTPRRSGGRSSAPTGRSGAWPARTPTRAGWAPP